MKPPANFDWRFLNNRGTKMKNIIAFILALLYSLPTPAQTNNADKMLYLGIIENNQAYVDQAIIDGAYLNRKYNEDYTPLAVACAANDTPSILKSLINAGADIRFQNTHKQNLLTVSLNSKANPENIRLLINYGLSPNEADGSGYTPLYTALISKAPHEAIGALLQGGANPNIPFDFGGHEIYPLTLAVAAGSAPETIKHLMDYSNQDAHFQALTATVTNDDSQSYQIFQDNDLLQK